MTSLKVRAVAVGSVIWVASFGLVMAERLVARDADPLVKVSPIEVSKSMLNVWADPDGGFVAVGGGGQIMFGDDAGWTGMSIGTRGSLNDVWGTASDDIFAVSSFGSIVHFDGSTWQVMFEGGPTLIGVWGSSNSDVFAVGAGGVILHYDGSTWSRMESGVDTNLVAIHGTSSSNVFAVAEANTVIHFDGTEWSRLTGGPQGHLHAVWAASDDDVFFAGTGVIGHFNGRDWSTEPIDPFDGIFDLVGVSSNEVYAVTMHHAVHRFNGSEWSLFSRTPERFWPLNLAVSASGEVVIVGFVDEIRQLRLPGTHTTGAILHYVPEVSR